jgi:hypothetical protein
MMPRATGELCASPGERSTSYIPADDRSRLGALAVAADQWANTVAPKSPGGGIVGLIASPAVISDST